MKPFLTKLTGDPVVLEFNDASVGSYATDDPVLRFVIESGLEILENNEGSLISKERTVDFCWVTYPDNLFVEANGEVLTLDEINNAFSTGLVSILKEAVKKESFLMPQEDDSPEKPIEA